MAKKQEPQAIQLDDETVQELARLCARWRVSPEGAIKRAALLAGEYDRLIAFEEMIRGMAANGASEHEEMRGFLAAMVVATNLPLAIRRKLADDAFERIRYQALVEAAFARVTQPAKVQRDDGEGGGVTSTRRRAKR